MITQLNYGDGRLGSHAMQCVSPGDWACTSYGGCKTQVWCQASDYTEYSIGTSSCESQGKLPVTGDDECRSAAEALGLDLSSMNVYTQAGWPPAGCVHEPGTNEFYVSAL